MTGELEECRRQLQEKEAQLRQAQDLLRQKDELLRLGADQLKTLGQELAAMRSQLSEQQQQQQQQSLAMRRSNAEEQACSYREARIAQLHNEVASIAKSNIQREREMGVDPLPFISQTQPEEFKLALGQAAAVEMGKGGAKRAQAQAARRGRKDSASPLGAGGRNGGRVGREARVNELRVEVDLPNVGPTPSMDSALGVSVPSAESAALGLLALSPKASPGQHEGGEGSQQRGLGGLPMKKALSGLSLSRCVSLLDGSPVDAASLSALPMATGGDMAGLPLSKNNSSTDTFSYSAPSINGIPMPFPGQGPLPGLPALPMSRNDSGIPMSRCLSLLDDENAAL